LAWFLLFDYPFIDTFGAWWHYMPEIATYALGTYAVFYLIKLRLFKCLWDFVLPVAVFSLYTLIICFVQNNHPFVVIFTLRQMFRFVFLFFAIAAFVKTEYQRVIVLKFICLIAIITTVIANLQFFFPGATFLYDLLCPASSFEVGGGEFFITYENLRPTATLGRFNHLAYFLVSAFAILLYADYLRAWPNKLRIFLAGFFFVGIAITTTRVGIVAALAVVGMQALFVLRKLKNLAIVFLLILVVCLGFYYGRDSDVSAYGSHNPIRRFQSIFSMDFYEKSMKAQRLGAAVAAFRATVENDPFFGFGLGTVGTNVTGSASSKSTGLFPDYSHLDEIEEYGGIAADKISDVGWISLWAQTGIVGVTIYLFMFWKWYHFFRKTIFETGKPVTDKLAIGQIFLAFFVLNIAISVYLDRTFSLVMYVLLGLGGSVVVSKKRRARQLADADLGWWVPQRVI
jgi:hypothetical protein